MQTDVDGGSYELYIIPKEGSRDMAPVSALVPLRSMRAAGLARSQRLCPSASPACDTQAASTHTRTHAHARTHPKHPSPPNLPTHPTPPHPPHPHPAQEAKRGYSAAAVFIARTRFAVLDKASNQLVIKDLANEVGGRVCLCVCAHVSHARG